LTDKLKPSTRHGQGKKSLESRLAQAKLAAEGRKPRAMMERGAFGIATRLVAELVSGLVVGGGIGWLLDRLLNTRPWLLVVFFILGAIAGIMNVFRAAAQMNAGQPPKTDDDTNDDTGDDTGA
jgi:ATP synthase protein I